MTSAPPDKPVFAARGNRAAALLLDLMLLLVIGSFASGMPFASMPAFALMTVLYFWLMPLTPLQGTLGKWICRIRLADRSGGRPTLRRAGIRAFAFIAWCALAVYLLGHRMPWAFGDELRIAVWFVFPLPWLSLWLLPRGESLFDLLAGTVVVRYGADAAAIANATPARKPGIFRIAATIVMLVLFGAVMSIPMSAMHDREFRTRVAYAISGIGTLKKDVAAFRARERRWPAPHEVGVAEWTPYPDGGGYRLQKDGSIVINFTVLPELKELVITFRPAASQDDQYVEWTCSASSGKPARYAPASCRGN